MTSTRDIQIADYDYQLPDERIAKFPLTQRDQSKLLVYREGNITTDTFANIADYLPADSLMVFNNTKVIQARLHFRKSTGALIEVFLLEPHSPSDYELMFQSVGSCQWVCLVGNLKKWKGEVLSRTFGIAGTAVTLQAACVGQSGANQLVELRWDAPIPMSDVIDAVGELPIPPYLNRDAEESDKTTYQTVYSKIKGSVAAPTAGLHFTPAVLDRLRSRGIDCEELTLHVGAGTFRPVKSADIGHHEMHTEYVAVRRATLEKLLAHRCQVTAVGTTSVRTLESLYFMGLKVLRDASITEESLHVQQWEPYSDDALLSTPAADAIAALLDWMHRNSLTVLHSSTQIIIVPGYRYRIVKRLVTNFHQPRSTLLLLVSAFVKGDWRTIYDYALSHDYRFLSYGDSSLLMP